MPKNRARLARVVVAVVTEKNNFASDFGLQPPRGPDFGHQKPLGKKPARLLPKTDDRCCHRLCQRRTLWFIRMLRGLLISGCLLAANRPLFVRSNNRLQNEAQENTGDAADRVEPQKAD